MESLRQAACRARQRNPAIRRIVLFGSFASGIPTPRSDADLLIVVAQSVQTEPSSRIPDALGWLEPLPCPLDLFVLTEDEIQRLEAQGSPVLREARENGIELLDCS